MEELITRTHTIKEAIAKLVDDTKEIAKILQEDQFTDNHLVFTEDGEYIVTLMVTPDGEFDADVKLIS